MTTHRFARDTAVIERWPSESPRFALSLVISLGLWLLAIITVIGLIYAAFLGLFFFILHLAFIAHVRGNGVRLGPDQFPDLHADVERMARRLGLDTVPETYVMQAGGTLNAFATRFLGANIVVLFSDLLEACGDNRAARDMIIAHELGHVKEGHLKWHWVLLPSLIVPFLGSALSRAREYTCDRYGLAGAGDIDGALTGLTILAAGAQHGPNVNREALVRQRELLSGVWMTIGQWLSTHPPLAKRLVALDPELGAGQRIPSSGPALAAAVMAFFFVGLGAVSVAVAVALPKWTATIEQAQANALAAGPSAEVLALRDSLGEQGTAEHAQTQIFRLVEFVEAERAGGRGVPTNSDDLYDRWNAIQPAAPEPIDPYDGLRLGFDVSDTSYTVWSSGPNGEPGGGDDLSRTVEVR